MGAVNGKMKFAVGYQFAEENADPFVKVVRDFREFVGEVYFPWVDLPSGRMPLTDRRGVIDWEGQRRLEKDLASFKEWKIKLNLLLNGNCYGKYGLSEYLGKLVCSTVDYLDKEFGLDAVTTASLTIARALKRNFKDLEVRASVNMRIGTVKSMEYLAGFFDGFCLQREHNRDFPRIKQLKKWCDARNKRLYILANSGCLNFCSGQIFHDNLVAHEKEINEMVNVKWNPFLCWNYYGDKKHWTSFLQNSWIRPEDIKNYRDYFPVIKLATRVHARPRMVLGAYAEEKFNGNLLNLFEPDYSSIFSPYFIDNSRFPDDWFRMTTACDKRCHECGYCGAVLKKVLRRGG